jgi:hypothetical protein
MFINALRPRSGSIVFVIRTTAQTVCAGRLKPPVRLSGSSVRSPKIVEMLNK